MNSSTIRTHLVRILHLRYKTASFPWKNEGSETTLATHWTTHQGSRQRTRRRSTCRHGHAWIGTESQSNWPEMRKTLEKPGFLSGEDRNRTFGCFLDVFEEFERYHSPSTLPLKTTRNRFPLASVYSVCSVVPTLPASVSHTRSLQIPGVQPGPKSMTLIFRTLPDWSAI